MYNLKYKPHRLKVWYYVSMCYILFLPFPLSLYIAQSTPDSISSRCDVLRSYHLSRTVAEVGSYSELEGASLEALIDTLFSPLHPFRVTAFLLAKRCVSFSVLHQLVLVSQCTCIQWLSFSVHFKIVP